MRVVAPNCICDHTTKTLYFPDRDYLEPTALIIAVNIETGETIYMANDPNLGGVFAGASVVLDFDTTGWTTDGTIQAIIEDMEVRQIVGNMVDRDKDSFNTVDNTRWTYPTLLTGMLVRPDGNVAGSSFVSVDMPADGQDLTYRVQSVKSWPVPSELTLGVTVSQRVFGEQIWLNWAGLDPADLVTPMRDSALPELSVTGTITVASNIGTVTVSEELATCGLKTGDSIYIYGADDNRVNYGPMLVTETRPATKTFLCALVAGNATYTVTGAHVVKLPQTDRLKYAACLRLFSASSGNADYNTRNGGGSPTVEQWNPGNSWDATTIPNIGGVNYATAPGSNYTVAFVSKAEIRMQHKMEMARAVMVDQDANAAPRSVKRKRKEIPDQTLMYGVEFGIDVLKNRSVPGVPITVAQKTASATAVLTCPGHPFGSTPGLINKWITIYGIRDNTNFANQTTALQVTVISATQISVTLGSSATATSYGGFFLILNGGQGPNIQNNNVQSYRKTADGLRLELTAISNWSETIGHVVDLRGFVNASNVALTALMGKYKVAAWTTTVMELEPLDGQDLSGVTTSATNAGGTVVRVTSLRMHYVKVKRRAEMRVDLPENEGDAATATSMWLQGGVLNGNQSVRLDQINGQGVTTAQNGTMVVGLVGPINNADMASGAKTSTGNTGTITPGNQAGTVFHIGVSATGGTTPTMDLSYEESGDDGTTWYTSYQLPRVTANGVIMTEPIRMNGTRYRWSWIINGTTPTFTVIINGKRLTWVPPLVKQFRDATSASFGTINLTTLASATPAYRCDGCQNFKLSLTLGTATTPPQIQLQVSDNAIDWANVGAILTGTASATVAVAVANTPAPYVRAIVTTIGNTLGAGAAVSIRCQP